MANLESIRSEILTGRGKFEADEMTPDHINAAAQYTHKYIADGGTFEFVLEMASQLAMRPMAPMFGTWVSVCRWLTTRATIPARPSLKSSQATLQLSMISSASKSWVSLGQPICAFSAPSSFLC